MQNNDEILKQNLIDAGCDERLISLFMVLRTQQNIQEMLSLLATHRKSILDRIHSEERQIYCLDYLTNRLKNDSGG